MKPRYFEHKTKWILRDFYFHNS